MSKLDLDIVFIIYTYLFDALYMYKMYKCNILCKKHKL